MDILTSPPFRSASLLWQPRPGAHVLTVICKATFTLRPGECEPAPDLDAPNEVDDHWDDDERRSLHAASDLVPFKRYVDVVVVGHAYAPPGRAVSALVARLAVAGVDKSIEVRADRVWSREGQVREGAPFARMPLRWERASGGPETVNPVGVRADGPVDVYGQSPLPNLQPLGFQPQWRGQPIPPTGFGPLAPTWAARRAMLHRHAESWDKHRWMARPLPEDLDAAFFNVAPPDQQVREIRGDEALLLESLHPEHPRLSTRLPGITPRAVVSRGGSVDELRMRCDTLAIDTDRGVCTLVWRGQVALARADEDTRVVVSANGAQPEIKAEVDATTTVPLGYAVAKAALPFQEGSPWSAAALAMAVARSGGGAEERGEDEGTGTVLGSVAALAEVLPFAVSRGPRDAPREREEDGETRKLGAVVLPLAAPAQAAPEVPNEADAVPTVAPPAMIGPLATAEIGERAEAREDVRETGPAVRVDEAAVAPSNVNDVAPLDDLPIERCAAIAASMARRPKDRGKILEENELTEPRWEALSRY